MAKNDILVFLPTYNEAGHVEEMRRRIQAIGAPVDIMFLDDNSTDGTGEVIDMFAAEDKTVLAVHRPGKEGIGGAHLEGIRRAYEGGYKILVTMDSDLVHKPEDIPAFLAASENADVVIGTRFEMKSSLDEWNLFRKVLTHLGHMLTRLLLRHNYDATGAFRVYRLGPNRPACIRPYSSPRLRVLFHQPYNPPFKWLSHHGNCHRVAWSCLRPFQNGTTPYG